MTWPSSGNSKVPDYEKDPPDARCPQCGSKDLDDGAECEDCHMLTKDNKPCKNCGGKTYAVVVCNDCEHAWRE